MTCKAKSLCLIKTKLATNKLSNDILCNMIVVILWLVCVFVGKKSFLATSIQHTNLQTEKQWVNGNTFGSKKSLWETERFTLTLGLPANHCFPGALWTHRPEIAALTTCYQTFTKENSQIFDVVTCSFLLSHSIFVAVKYQQWCSESTCLRSSILLPTHEVDLLSKFSNKFYE